MRSLAPSLTHSRVLYLVLRLYICLSIFLSFLFFCLYPSVSVKYSVSVSMSACFFFLNLSHALFVFKSVIFQLIYFSSSAYLLSPSYFSGMQVIFPCCWAQFTMEETSTLFRTASDSQSAFLSLHLSLCICLIVSRSN